MCAASTASARSSEQPGAGLALFEQAFELARADGDRALAVDAAHMLAIGGDSETWTARAVEIAEPSDEADVRYWLGPLYNNLGWSRYEAGDAACALEAFALALAAPGKPRSASARRLSQSPGARGTSAARSRGSCSGRQNASYSARRRASSSARRNATARPRTASSA